MGRAHLLQERRAQPTLCTLCSFVIEARSEMREKRAGVRMRLRHIDTQRASCSIARPAALRVPSATNGLRRATAAGTAGSRGMCPADETVTMQKRAGRLLNPGDDLAACSGGRPD